MDYKHLASKLGIDDDDFMELVELFITITLSELDKIRQCVASGNAQTAGLSAHSIKGSAGNLGFEEMAGIAKKMEMQAAGGSLENFDVYITDLETRVNALTTS